MNKVRIIIADDHPGFREGLAKLFADEEGLEVVARAGDGEETIRLVTELKPDVAIIDVAMPGIDGIETARCIRAACPNTQVLILSAYDYQAYILASLRVGAAGYLLKNTSISDMVSAIRLVHSGEAVYDLKTLSKVLERLAPDYTKTKKHLVELHAREVEVIKLVAKGLSNKKIADGLCISERTAQTHLTNIFEKLGVRTRTQAIIRAIQEGWLSPDDLPTD